MIIICLFIYFYFFFYNRNTVLQRRPITPETLNELADKLYESLLQEASVNFVSSILMINK